MLSSAPSGPAAGAACAATAAGVVVAAAGGTAAPTSPASPAAAAITHLPAPSPGRIAPLPPWVAAPQPPTRGRLIAPAHDMARTLGGNHGGTATGSVNGERQRASGGPDDPKVGSSPVAGSGEVS